MVEVLFLIVQPNSPPRKFIWEHTGMMGFFGYIIFIINYPIWCHHLVGIIQLLLMMVLHLVFLLAMVKLVWVLGPPTFPPRNFIVALMVVI